MKKRTKKHTRRRLRLSAPATAVGARIRLDQPAALAAGGFTPDRDAGILRNVSIITAGPAMGHGFEIDGVMMKQLASGISAKAKGVKSRLTHPDPGFFGMRRRYK